MFGHIPDVSVGQNFTSREEVARVGIHAPRMAGIWGAQEGACSIVLSGGYEDDIDDKYDEDIIKKYDNLMEFLKYTTTDMNNKRLDKQTDDFSLYINISKYAKNSLPRDIIVNDFFTEYRVKKSQFPIRTCYSLDDSDENKVKQNVNIKKRRRR